MSIDPTQGVQGVMNLFQGALQGASPGQQGGAQQPGQSGPQLPGDLMSALNGAVPSAFQQALQGAVPGGGDIGSMIQQFLGGAAQPGGGSAPAQQQQQGPGRTQRRPGGRRSSPGGGKRRAKQGGKARRGKRRGAVEGAKASRTQAPGSNKGVKGGDFKALTQKLGKLGITKQDVSNLSQKYGVPEKMILGVMMQESKGNPTITSPAGAKGLMQLMPGTARELGVTNRSDPKQNLEGGVKYLGQMLKKFGGDPSKALAAYNAGPGRVQRAGGVPHIRETQNYVRTISGNFSAAQAAFDAW